MLRERALFGSLFNAIDQGICVIEVLFDASGQPTDYRFVLVNDAFERQTGLADVVGRTIRELAPNHEQHWFSIYGDIAITGQPARFERPAAALGRWYDVYAFRVGEPAERKIGVIFSDISGRKSEERRLELLTRELNHRVQNIYAVISGLIRLTQADTVDTFKANVLGRINALANSQRRLFERSEHAVSLSTLIEDARSQWLSDDREQVTWSGPDVSLAEGPANSIAMSLHELGTNAIKYGALSAPGGRVAITWTVGEENILHLRWVESGGPAVTSPKRRGIGTGVITQCARDDLCDGAVVFNWHPDGLICSLAIPLTTKKLAPELVVAGSL